MDIHNVYLENLHHLTGVEFEKLCHILLEKMGFEVTDTKISGDGGIDLIAQNHQPLLSGKYIIQCKRYTGGVGEPIIRDLYGVVTSERANKGILITTGYFTKQAESFSQGKPLELIDGVKLQELISTYLKDGYETNARIHASNKHEVTYDSNFLPLIPSPLFELSMNTYVKLKHNLTLDSNNLTNVGKMIEFLQYFVLKYNKNEWDTVADKDFNRSKYNAIVSTIMIAERIKPISFLYPQYLSIVAQNYFLLGYWNIALEYYEKMLRLPGVLFDVEYSRSYYTGELETASRIIHNMCVICVCMNETAKAKDIMKQYKYVFDLEFQRTLRLMRNNPQLQNGFEEEAERLRDVFEKKYFFFDTTLCGFFFKGESVLSAIYSDCIRNNESCKIQIEDSDEYQITKKDFSTIDIVYKDILESRTVWETSYHHNKSIELIDLNAQ